MYNLLVSSLFSQTDNEPLTISKSRFLEFTSESISAQLISLSTEAVKSVKSWPCLVMSEGRAEEAVRLASITSLSEEGSDYIVGLSLIESVDRIVNAEIFRIREALDIEQFEFSRHHWAIKDRDLLQILTGSGLQVDNASADRFANFPLPAPPRADLLRARTVIGNWGHTEIDDLLLEAGIDTIPAGREIGSRRDRANAIIRFALQNPSSKTAENSLLSAFLLRAALPEESPAQTSDSTTSATTTEGPASDNGERLGVADARSPNRVFVVHGRDDTKRTAVVRFLSEIGLEAIVLHEQPNMGRHLLTKFIEEAELVTFAIILMTADDVGGLSGSSLQPRARQNVILELGYFLSHLGQRRVCALVTPGLESPSDFDGIVYITVSQDGRWKEELLRELVAAEMPVQPIVIRPHS